MDLELNISEPCNPRIDQDRTQVLKEKKKNGSVNQMYEEKFVDYHTVRTPQVSSTMHDQNTINTAKMIQVNKRVIRRDKYEQQTLYSLGCRVIWKRYLRQV